VTAAWRRLRAVPALLTALSLVLLTGCQGAYDLPLPGGAATGDDAYRVTVEFSDVLDLVPQSAVKVDDVTVGSVEDITLHDWTARVVVRLAGDVELPDNAVAEVRQTSLLGEKYVSLSPPAAGNPVGHLGDGDVIPLDRTTRGAEVEEVLGALSLLLNGGGVAQLQVINRELGDALEGRESDVRSVLSQLDTFVTGLEQQKSEIVRAIEAVDRLTATLQRQKDDLAVALDQIPGGLQVLADQREQLTTMLTALSDLGVTATRVIDASQQDTVANLRALDPVLSQLAASGDALTDSLQLLATYPFSDSAVAGIKGDYTNLQVTADLDFHALCLQVGLPNCERPDGPPLPEPPPLPTPTLPTVPTDPCALLPGGVLPPTCPLDDPATACESLGGVVGADGTCDFVEQACAELGGVLGTNGDCDVPQELCDQLDVPLFASCQPPDGDGTPLPLPSIPLPTLGSGGLLGAGPAGPSTSGAGYDTGLAMLLLRGVVA
jgi:phospholipid/cholesterol/gamma-HCH transport system substrate-binding protein